RVDLVTGFQTCALPISGAPRFGVVRDDGTPHSRGRGPIARRARGLSMTFRQAHWDEPLLMEKRSAPDVPIDVADLVPPKLRRERSEERRVGKGARAEAE